jgi:DUF917 family protein
VFHAPTFSSSDEIGGSNGMQSLIMAGIYGIPAFDGDLMGRGAFLRWSGKA